MLSDKKKFVPLLNALKKIPGADVGEIVDFLQDDAVEQICECVFNLIHTPLNLSKKKKCHVKNYLTKHCSIHRLNKIATKKVPLSKRRKALKQEGKGLPMILATVLPFLANLFLPK